MTKPQKPSRRNRPRLPPEARRESPLSIRLTADERERIEANAWNAGVTITAWIVEKCCQPPSES